MVKITQINFNVEPKEWGGALYEILRQLVADVNAKETTITAQAKTIEQLTQNIG